MKEHQSSTGDSAFLMYTMVKRKDYSVFGRLRAKFVLKTKIMGIEVLIFHRWADLIRKLNAAQVRPYKQDLSRNHPAGR